MSQGARVTFDSTDLKYLTFSTTPTFTSLSKFFNRVKYIRRILRHGDQCGLSDSFGFSIPISWRHGFYLHIESCDLQQAAGRLHFQPLLPCREPAGSCRNHCHSVLSKFGRMCRSVPGPYQTCFSAEALNQNGSNVWVRPVRIASTKMWQKNKDRRIL